MSDDHDHGLRAEVHAIVARLLADTREGDAIELDTVGAAIGAMAISQDEIDRVLTVIEAKGRRIVSPEGSGESNLKLVLDAARALRNELGRAPRAEEIATRANITREAVDHALALARVMQR